MNTKKGLFRLTFVISIFVGIITAFLNELFIPRHSVTIEIPNNWQMELTKERRQELDGIVLRMLKNKESNQNIQAIVDDFNRRYAIPSKEEESLKPDYLLDNSEFKRLSQIEQLNIKKQFIESFPEIKNLKKSGRHPLRIEFTFRPGWRELSPLILIGLVSPWIIYLFTRWVVIGFIVGGFKHKT